MADNVNYTPGMGVKIGSDEVDGVQYERVKICIGADGEIQDIDNGQQVAANSLPVVIASNQPVISVGSAIATVAQYALELSMANTEYSQVLPSNTAAVQFQCRSLFDVRYAYVTGKVASSTEPYGTIKAGGIYWKENVKLASSTIYFASSESGIIVEIETWS
jgi:hypothetical protein